MESSSSKKAKAQSESSDFARDAVKKDFELSESDSKELGIPKSKTAKKKKILKQEAKQPRTEYLKFFKFYYDKLTREHPRWSASQISTIIKLLWKKKLTTDKTAAKTSSRVLRPGRKISGRLAFRRANGYSGMEAAERWRQLPMETKRFWRLRGLGRENNRSGIPSSINFKKSGSMRKGSDSSINTQAVKNLNFMKKNIV